MDVNISTQFVSALTEFLQFLCNKYVDFDEFTLVTGQLYVSSDGGHKTEFQLNEKLCTSLKNKVVCLSNSFPSTISKANSQQNLPLHETSTKYSSSCFSQADRFEVQSVSIPSYGNDDTEACSIPQDCEPLMGDTSPKSARSERKKRIKRKSDDENPYKCEFCNKSYDVISKLTKHMKNHSKPHKCDTCSKSYASNADLQRHMRIHSGEKPFICAVCARAFPDSSRLKMHEKVHSEEKLHSCGICGKAFRQPGNLKSHIYTHTGEKPFQCDFCGKCFTQRSHMKIHRLIHNKVKKQRGKGKVDNKDAQSSDDKSVVINISQPQITVPKSLKRPRKFGEKLHYCDVCGKSFRQVGNLKIHKYTHTGEKPFQCNFCGKCFTQKSHLNVHRAKYCKYKFNEKGFVLENPQTIHEDISNVQESHEINVADANAAILLEQSLKEEELQHSEHPSNLSMQSHVEASQPTFNPSNMNIIHQVDVNAAALIEQSLSVTVPVTVRPSSSLDIDSKWQDTMQRYV